MKDSLFQEEKGKVLRPKFGQKASAPADKPVSSIQPPEFENKTATIIPLRKPDEDVWDSLPSDCNPW